MIHTPQSDPSPRAFRRALAERLAAVLGTLSLASAAGCWNGEIVLAGFGGGPTGTSSGGDPTTTGSMTTSGATTSAMSTCSAPCAGASQKQCFTPLTLPCPTDPCEVLLALSCDNNATGWQACTVSSGPTQFEDGSCCYETTGVLQRIPAPAASERTRGQAVALMEAHGCLDAATVASVLAGALAEVVGPAARALVTHASPRRAGRVQA